MLHSGEGAYYRVVGVVGDVRPAAGGASLEGAAYLPVPQDEGVFEWFATATVVVRGDDPSTAIAAVRRVVRSLDPELAVFNARRLRDEVAELLAGPRFSASLLSLFALAALLLAGVGVYGVMAYTTRVRTREIAVRMALGAPRAAVLRLILRDGAIVVALGLALGALGATWTADLLAGMLHDVPANDPLAAAGVAMLLSSVGLVAAWLPARRAMRIDAMEALRDY